MRGLAARYGVRRGDGAVAASSTCTSSARRRGSCPTIGRSCVEQFRDEMGAVRIVLHAPFGGRVNAPWGMALAQRVREALPGVEVQVQTTDDGIMLRLPNIGTSAPLSALMHLSASEAEIALAKGNRRLRPRTVATLRRSLHQWRPTDQSSDRDQGRHGRQQRLRYRCRDGQRAPSQRVQGLP